MGLCPLVSLKYVLSLVLHYQYLARHHFIFICEICVITISLVTAAL